jgi:hypothetical protein
MEVLQLRKIHFQQKEISLLNYGNVFCLYVYDFANSSIEHLEYFQGAWRICLAHYLKNHRKEWRVNNIL